jgi:hypothetical protein
VLFLAFASEFPAKNVLLCHLSHNVCVISHNIRHLNILANERPANFPSHYVCPAHIGWVISKNTSNWISGTSTNDPGHGVRRRLPPLSLNENPRAKRPVIHQRCAFPTYMPPFLAACSLDPNGKLCPLGWLYLYKFVTVSLLKRYRRNGRFTSETAVRRFQKRNRHLDTGALDLDIIVFQDGNDGRGYRNVYSIKYSRANMRC